MTTDNYNNHNRLFYNTLHILQHHDPSVLLIGLHSEKYPKPIFPKPDT